jgi:hypothetical protein
MTTTFQRKDRGPSPAGFADSFRYLVLNKSREKARPGLRSLYDYTTNLATACVLIHLSLIYLISGLAKAHADVWYHGDALYYIFLVERFQGWGFIVWRPLAVAPGRGRTFGLAKAGGRG